MKKSQWTIALLLVAIFTLGISSHYVEETTSKVFVLIAIILVFYLAIVCHRLSKKVGDAKKSISYATQPKVYPEETAQPIPTEKPLDTPALDNHLRNFLAEIDAKPIPPTDPNAPIVDAIDTTPITLDGTFSHPAPPIEIKEPSRMPTMKIPPQLPPPEIDFNNPALIPRGSRRMYADVCHFAMASTQNAKAIENKIRSWGLPFKIVRPDGYPKKWVAFKLVDLRIPYVGFFQVKD